MDSFFTDIMNTPEINWGTLPLQVRTKTRTKQNGYMTDPEIVDEKWIDLTSPQLIDPQSVRMKGFGEYADGEVYECFSLIEIPLNDDPTTYRTIIYNKREYEIIRCSPFGVNRGDTFNGYYDIYFGRKANSQGGYADVD